MLKVPVVIRGVPKGFLPLVSSGDDVIERTEEFYPRFSSHAARGARCEGVVNISLSQVCPLDALSLLKIS